MLDKCAQERLNACLNGCGSGSAYVLSVVVAALSLAQIGQLATATLLAGRAWAIDQKRKSLPANTRGEFCARDLKAPALAHGTPHLHSECATRTWCRSLVKSAEGLPGGPLGPAGWQALGLPVWGVWLAGWQPMGLLVWGLLPAGGLAGMRCQRVAVWVAEACMLSSPAAADAAAAILLGPPSTGSHWGL